MGGGGEGEEGGVSVLCGMAEEKGREENLLRLIVSVFCL